MVRSNTVVIKVTRRKPIPYLDTNVILDYLRGRGKDNRAILLIENIKRKRIHCYTSNYTILELIDREQEERWIERCRERGLSLDDISRRSRERDLEEPDLRDAFNSLEKRFLKPFIDADIIEMVTPTTTQWDKIYELLAHYNFTIDDAFHVDAAIGKGCNIFISNDSHLVKLINESGLIPASTLDNLDRRLDELQMRRIIPR